VHPSYDVIIVGAGPGGSTAAWALAQRGITVLLLDRARFPREKVCGDYVEPRGLRILARMGCLAEIEATAPLAVAESAAYVNGTRRYRAAIPFYTLAGDEPRHGYVVPRETLDHVLLRAAERAGADVRQGVSATHVRIGARGVAVETAGPGTAETYRASLVVGADGVHSLVARSAGVLTDDPRYTVLSQRAYAEGVAGELGEATVFFDRDSFPGYGWIFPMAEGRVNLGVGVLAEAVTRRRLRVPELFTRFLGEVKRLDRRWADLRLCRPPIGGVVKTYGGAGRNHFDGGLLVGDAGSFADPMTGEGIAPAMESALLAAPVLEQALERGRFDAGALSPYGQAYRAYFDPSMIFLDLCAAGLRNHHLADAWLRAVIRGYDIARTDPDYIRTAGAYFGGLTLRPSGMMSRVGIRMVSDWLTLAPRALGAAVTGQPSPVRPWARDFLLWQAGWWSSLVSDPPWHLEWMRDLTGKWRRALAVMSSVQTDPRAAGIEVTPLDRPARVRSKETAMSDDVVIEVRVNENTRRVPNPNVPYSVDEIVDQSLACWREGASIIHYHPRDSATGNLSMDVRDYADTVRRIKQGSDLLTMPTNIPSYAAANLTTQDRIAPIMAIAKDSATRPELGPIDLITCNTDTFDEATGKYASLDYVYVNTTRDWQTFADSYKAAGIKPVPYLWNISSVRALPVFIQMGFLEGPVWCELVLTEGGLWSGHPGSLRGLQAFLDFFPARADWQWTVLLHGGDLLKLAADVMEKGGHISIGLGDYHYMQQLTTPTNPALVRRIVEIARALGRSPASPADVRRRLGVSEAAGVAPALSR
jgi:menaquinone-9 beta-reductase